MLSPSGRLMIVDFAAHDSEELRTVHAHARLGFEDDLIARTFVANDIHLAHQASLEGGRLAVKIWLGQKRGLATPESKPTTEPRLRIVT